jgi:uncharacterized protein DUF4912
MPVAPAFQKKPARGGPFRLAQNPVLQSPWVGVAPAEEDESEELPELYGTQALYLVARDPEKLFAYWDVDWSCFSPGEEPNIRLCRADGSVARTAAINRADAGHYADVPADGATYYAEICARRGDSWRSVARSGLVTMPPGAASTDLLARYVTIPASLTFRALGEMMSPHAQSPEEPPVETLARLQNEFVVHGSSLFERMPLEQRSSLESLFSPAPAVGGGDSSSHAPPEAVPIETPPISWREALVEQLLHSEALGQGHPRFARSITSPG